MKNRRMKHYQNQYMVAYEGVTLFTLERSIVNSLDTHTQVMFIYSSHSQSGR